MIFAKVQEHEWKAECMRVDKKLTELVSQAKEARRKNDHQHFDTVKIRSSVNIDNYGRKLRI